MEVFEVIFPILLIPLMGFCTARRGWLSTADCDSIAKFAFSYLVPSLLFIGTATATIPDEMDWGFLSAFYLSVILVYILSIFISRYLLGFSSSEQSVFGMGCSYSNATIIGIPVCVYSLGNKALLPLFVIISVHNLVLFCFGIVVAERHSLTLNSFMLHIQRLLEQLLKSPITGSLIAGIIVNISNFGLYPPIHESLELFSRSAIPVALFVLGASMNKYHIKGHIKPALIMVALKNVCLPILVWFFSCHVFSVSPLWGAVAILTSAMPTGISAYIFSKKYLACEDVVSTGTIISTVCSIVTLSIALAYVQTII